MNNLKHVGIIVPSRRKVVVAFRKIPSDPKHCVVITTENLSADEHDTLMKTVESNAGQSANEFADVMARTLLPDGRQMLQHFHNTGKMLKVATSDVLMTPNTSSSVLLSELNDILDKMKNPTAKTAANDVEVVSEMPYVADIATVPEVPVSALPETELKKILEDSTEIKKYADKLRDDAKALRNQAKALVEMAGKIEKLAE